nr:P2X purinoceptor 6 [Columba livia]
MTMLINARVLVRDRSSARQGEDVIFLVTNFVATAQQAQGTCPESAAVLDAVCSEDADCPMGNPVARGNGIKTGKCVMFNTTHSTCEIYGWCPVENSTLPRKPLLAEAENFTLFIKNTVHFTKFNFSKCNTLQTNDPTYFKTCLYDSFFSPFCPVFRVRDMVEAAGETFGDLALLGGSIGVRIEWDCDLDQPAARCQPQYSFSLQDRNYNFRTASYYWDSQRQLHRNLLKLYGIRFDISVHGQVPSPLQTLRARSRLLCHCTLLLSAAASPTAPCWHRCSSPWGPCAPLPALSFLLSVLILVPFVAVTAALCWTALALRPRGAAQMIPSDPRGSGERVGAEGPAGAARVAWAPAGTVSADPAAVVSPQATVLCDLVLLYLDAKAEFYWKEKFEEAKPPKCKTEAAA